MENLKSSISKKTLCKWSDQIMMTAICLIGNRSLTGTDQNPKLMWLAPAALRPTGRLRSKLYKMNFLLRSLYENIWSDFCLWSVSFLQTFQKNFVQLYATTLCYTTLWYNFWQSYFVVQKHLLSNYCELLSIPPQFKLLYGNFSSIQFGAN